MAAPRRSTDRKAAASSSPAASRSPAPQPVPDLGWPPSLNRLPAASVAPAAVPVPSLQELSPLTAADTRLSANFGVSDLGGVPDEHVENARRLCCTLLEPLLAAAGGLQVLACWKHASDCPCGSLHPLALAADVTCRKMTLGALYDVARRLQPATCPYGEIVLHKDRLHLALTGTKRRDEVGREGASC